MIIKKTKIILATAILSLHIYKPVLANPCAAVDDVNIGWRPTEELITQACMIESERQQKYNRVLTHIGPVVHTEASARDRKVSDKCSGALGEIMHILVSRGVTEKVSQLCQRKASNIITRPWAAKRKADSTKIPVNDSK